MVKFDTEFMYYLLKSKVYGKDAGMVKVIVWGRAYLQLKL